MGITAPSNSEPLHRNDKTMRYRPLGSTGLEVSALSFGCMRLSSDQDLNTRLISAAIDNGINYFETTRHYIEGTCQHKTAPGLKGRTAGIIVSGKEGIRPDSTAYLFRKEIQRQLDILGLSHFKFFQVGWFCWELMPHLLKPGGVLDGLREAGREGLVQHVGFTGHDKPDNFITCIETGLFDSITVPYNMLNRSYEPVIARAGELGMGVIAMCPVAGGVLSNESREISKGLGVDMPTTEAALRFVLSNPNVSSACSGMNTMEQLEQNVATVRQFDPDEKPVFDTMREGLDRMNEILGKNFCTGCQYCIPCPHDVPVPMYMEMYRQWKLFGYEDHVRTALNSFKTDSFVTDLSACTRCGMCEEKCPSGVQIRRLLEELKEMREGA